MKLKSIFTALFLTGIISLAITGCKKQSDSVAPDASADNNALYIEQANSIIDEADISYNEIVVSGGSETEAFYADNEGLNEAYTLTESDMDAAGFKRTDKRYFACLKKLQLSDSQIHMIRRALFAYEGCKDADVKAHRAAYAKLVIRIESARKELLSQLQNGKITKQQFEDGMAKLRKEFNESLRYIKTSFAKNLKACYYKFMYATKSILTERQWQAFVDCYR